MIFNIYYINFPKVYEIKMMLSNIISKGMKITNDNANDGEAFINAKLGFKLFHLFDSGVETGGKIKGSDSKKVLETFEVKTTKSIVLNEVFEKATTVLNFENIKEGELIKVDNLALELVNETELRTVKLFTSGAFKDMVTPGANGFDINNLLNSIFKDYSYKIRGNFENSNQKLLIKIPLTFENEFESSYSVDDLFVGKVSVIGIYKGKIKIENLKNSFEFFQEIGNLQNINNLNNNSQDDEIQESQYSKNSDNFVSFLGYGDGIDYHYIDLLAIVQNVNIP